MIQQNNNVIYVVDLGAEAKLFTHRRCKVLTRGGGGGGDGASFFSFFFLLRTKMYKLVFAVYQEQQRIDIM